MPRGTRYADFLELESNLLKLFDGLFHRYPKENQENGTHFVPGQIWTVFLLVLFFMSDPGYMKKTGNTTNFKFRSPKLPHGILSSLSQSNSFHSWRVFIFVACNGILLGA